VGGGQTPVIAAADSDDVPIVQLADSSAGGRQEMNPDEGVRTGPPAAELGPAAPLAYPGDSDHTPGHIAPPISPDHTGGGSMSAPGAGSAHTNASQPPMPTPTDPTATQSPPPANTGSPASGGVGPASMTPAGAGDGAADGLGRVVDSDRPPPWQSAGWPAQADAARRQADTGQIPAAYVDLVRDYFSRESE
jgi:hypothetical protein